MPAWRPSSAAVSVRAPSVAGMGSGRRVDGASHWMQLDDPDRVNALLLEFLGGGG